jgi:enamine deaminase RidA (YjgF/YER057c/UK114 family)
MEPVNPPGAPKPVGHYSPGLKHNGMMYVSGQLPLSTEQEPGQFGSVEQQTEQVVKNVQAILQGGGLELKNIAKVTL